MSTWMRPMDVGETLGDALQWNYRHLHNLKTQHCPIVKQWGGTIPVADVKQQGKKHQQV